MQVDKIGCMWMKVDAGGPEYDVRVPGIPGTGIFLIFLWYRKKLVPEKVSVSVTEKFGTGKKVSVSVSEEIGTGKSIGIGIGNIWYRNKVSVSVSFKILGTVTL